MSVVELTACLVAVASLLTGAEMLALRGDFRAGGLMDPRIAVPLRRYVLVRRLPVSLVPALAIAQMAVAVGLVVAVRAGVPLYGFTVALAALMAVQIQLLPYGRDAADDMALIVTAGLAAASLPGADGFLHDAALGFIAAQLCLCYFSSGASKLAGPRWRSGEAVVGILRTASYGSRPLSAMLARSPAAARALGWCVIAGELAFPVAIVLGGPAAVAALAVAACFHIANALAMGLNRFVPWFAAAYPATVWIFERYGLLALWP